MNRPGRVHNPGRLRGYVVAPELAGSGWRLSIPGGPDGGQYHGYIGPDSATGWPAGEDEIGPEVPAKTLSGSSAGPWDSLWSGVVLHEGETLSDYVYRSPGEVRPRANAAGVVIFRIRAQVRRGRAAICAGIQSGKVIGVSLR